MKKFNKNVTTSTRVRLPGEAGFRSIKDIHNSRQWIEIAGLEGSFQLGHIKQFTNKGKAPSYPALDDIYRIEGFDSVFKKYETKALFVGRLNGRTLKQFSQDQI